jgi:hypothetical protein
MSTSNPQRVMLNPNDLDYSMQQLSEIYGLSLAPAREIILLFPRSATMMIDEALAPAHGQTPFTDKFTFDLDRDELVVFDHDPETLFDALIEMAMYLSGFSTLMGVEDAWVVEFAIGAWKPVKKSIRRRLNLPIEDRPRGIVGLPAVAQNTNDPKDQLFHTLVTYYDQVSFHQMVMLAARDDITVYFPDDTHPRVLAVYVYMQRAMQEVGKDLDLQDYQVFNTRLLEKLQQLEVLFKPGTLPAPTWLHLLDNQTAHPTRRDPFEAFIDELFPDDDDADNVTPQ